MNTLDGYAYVIGDYGLFNKLDKLREHVGSITLTSGYRTQDYNASVGGSTNSNHIKGLAVDAVFDFQGWSHLELRSILVDLGFNNVGFYYDKHTNKLRWLHLDTGKCWGDGNGWQMFTDDYCEKTYYV